VRLSQSFNEAEVEWLGEVLRGLTRGADLKVLARSPMLGVMMKKVDSMKRRHESMKHKAPLAVNQTTGSDRFLNGE